MRRLTYSVFKRTTTYHISEWYESGRLSRSKILQGIKSKALAESIAQALSDAYQSGLSDGRVISDACCNYY